MSEEENPAVPAATSARPQLGLTPQNRSQYDVVLPYQTAYFTLAVPIGAELKMFLDFDD
jgi:hypothetical protein